MALNLTIKVENTYSDGHESEQTGQIEWLEAEAAEVELEDAAAEHAADLSPFTLR